MSQLEARPGFLGHGHLGQRGFVVFTSPGSLAREGPHCHCSVTWPDWGGLSTSPSTTLKSPTQNANTHFLPTSIPSVMAEKSYQAKALAGARCFPQPGASALPHLL